MAVAGPSRLGATSKAPTIGKAKRTNIYQPAFTSTQSSCTLDDDHDSLFEEISMREQRPTDKGKAPVREQDRPLCMGIARMSPHKTEPRLLALGSNLIEPCAQTIGEIEMMETGRHRRKERG